jgi:hypothetical protein
LVACNAFTFVQNGLIVTCAFDCDDKKLLHAWLDLFEESLANFCLNQHKLHLSIRLLDFFANRLPLDGFVKQSLSVAVNVNSVMPPQGQHVATSTLNHSISTTKANQAFLSITNSEELE